jgi:hypothetical protein
MSLDWLQMFQGKLQKLVLSSADRLEVGEQLHVGEFLVSLNGCFNATVLKNGNLVVYRSRFHENISAGKNSVNYIQN